MKDENETLKAEHAAVVAAERRQHEILKEQHDTALAKSKAEGQSDRNPSQSPWRRR